VLALDEGAMHLAADDECIGYRPEKDEPVAGARLQNRIYRTSIA
jgi:hypothetical protein